MRVNWLDLPFEDAVLQEVLQLLLYLGAVANQKLPCLCSVAIFCSSCVSPLCALPALL